MADKKYLKNVYDDFFGPVIDGVREGIKETKKTRASLDPEASLKQAEDAVLIDTTHMTIDEAVEAILKVLEAK